MEKFRILQIDAWATEGYWTWNNWHHVGTYHESEYGELTEETALQCFANKLSADLSELKQKAYIDDDQHNLVLVNKETDEPIFAIEYGNK